MKIASASEHKITQGPAPKGCRGGGGGCSQSKEDLKKTSGDGGMWEVQGVVVTLLLCSVRLCGTA